MKMPDQAPDSPMHIACATDAGYFKHCAAMLASLIAFNPGVHVHVLCTEDVSDEARRELADWAAKRGASLECIVPVVRLPESLPGLRRLTRAAWLRLFLPETLPGLRRVLYLDVDLVVQRSLHALWSMDLGSNWVAAVSDITDVTHSPALYRRVGFSRPEEYFNSGVLLIDLERFRRERVAEQALQFAADHPERVLLADQDPLNVVLRTHRLPLPLEWNVLAPIFEGGIVAREFPFSEEQTRRARAQPAVVHYSGPWKPWHHRARHPLRHLYADYRKQTPWPQWQKEGATLKHRLLRLVPESWARSMTTAYWAARESLGLVPNK
jgi:lipopolysaccharide biosynthesis glycosyltransferase